MCTLHVVKNAIWNRVNTYITNVSQVCQPHCSKIRSMFPNFKNAVYVYNVAYCWLAQCTHYSQPMTAVLFQSSQCVLLCNRDVGVALYVTFCWTARLPVTTALFDSSCSAHTAVDWYSMCREDAEVVMSRGRPLGGDSRSVVRDARLKSMNAVSLVASTIEDAA